MYAISELQLMFSFEESNESSNIALDDVSMIAGYCSKCEISIE